MAKNKNKNKNQQGEDIPQGGLYEGDAGSLAAAQSPDNYAAAILRQAGMLGDSGSDYDVWLETEYIPNLIQQYGQAAGGVTSDETLAFDKWLANTYGATMGGEAAYAGPGVQIDQTGGLGGGKKKKKQQQQITQTQSANNPFTAGTLGAGADQGFQDYWAETDQIGHFNNRMRETGLSSLNGNAEFDQWLNTSWLPEQQKSYKQAQSTNPALKWKEHMADPAQATRARNAFANRSSLYRLPGVASTLTSYSMWD